MKPVLLLVDIQNDYFSGGPMALTEMEAAATNAQQLLKNCVAKAYPFFMCNIYRAAPTLIFYILDIYFNQFFDGVRW